MSAAATGTKSVGLVSWRDGFPSGDRGRRPRTPRLPVPLRPAEPPPGVGQWIGGIRAMRDGTLGVARAHLDAMRFVDG